MTNPTHQPSARTFIEKYTGAFPDSEGRKQWKTWEELRADMEKDLREIASISWEAGKERIKQELCYVESPITAPNKEQHLTNLFKDQ